MPRPALRTHHSAGVWAGIALAGAAGSVLRQLITQEGGWGTIVLANLLGCGVLGVLVARGRATPVLAAGFCGGLTTFSGVCAQALTAARGERVGALSTTGFAAAHLLPAALGLLALNAAVGLAAFLLARRVAGDGPRGPRAGATPPRPAAASGEARP